MSQSDNTAVNAIDSFFYLFFTRFIIIIIPFIIVIALVRYQAIQAVNCSTSCVGVNLSGRDLHQNNLSNSDMVEANLQYSDLNKVNLSWADLSGANLVGVNLQDANLQGTNLVGADLTGANLRNTILEDTDFRGANLTGVDLTRARLTKTKLDGAILTQAKLVEADLHGVYLAGTNLTEANFTGANLNGANLNGTAISGSNFSGCSMIKTEMNGLWANLTNLTGANLTEASLAGTSFVGANLTSVNFSKANMVGSILIGARLNGATLSGANLTGARMFVAELQPKDLAVDTLLNSLNELQKQQLIQNADMSGIIFNDQTIWPAGKNTLLEGMFGSSMEVVDDAMTNKKQPLNAEALKNIDRGKIQLPTVTPSRVTGIININGSSSVYPLTNVIAQGFKAQGFRDAIKVGDVGTGGGIKGFCQPQPDDPVDIVAASRLMTKEELTLCAQNGRHPFRLTIGIDAIAIIANPINTSVNNLTSEQLPLLFNTENWSNIDPKWPQTLILRYTDSPGSGVEFLVNTLLNGNQQALIEAPHITFGSSTDIVLGVASNQDALGFIGYAYYKQNSDTMKLLSINDIKPSNETVYNKTYPLIRPLYLYSDISILKEKPQVAAFLNFYLTYVNVVIEKTGYFPLPSHVLDQQESTFLTASRFSKNN